MRELNEAKKKQKGGAKDDVLWQMARTEFELGLYFDHKKLGPVLLYETLRTAIVEGARMTKNGRLVEQSVLPVEKMVKLVYEGPRDIEGMWAGGQGSPFVDMRPVAVGQARIMRCRPVFLDWSATFSVLCNEERLGVDALATYVKAAGLYMGLGDARTLGFGRFSVEAA
jgi:hypothetical protein